MRLLYVLAAVCLLSACAGNNFESSESSEAATANALHHLQSEALPPGPHLFLEGLVSTGENEFGITFSPDGNTAYFCRSGRARANVCAIFVTRWDGSAWSKPEIASFSGAGFDVDPFVLSDGSMLLFNSRRPTAPDDTDNDLNIWAVERTESGWGEPYPVEALNSEAAEIFQSATNDGRIFFCSDRGGSPGDSDIYVTDFDGESFSKPRNLGAPINTTGGQSNPLVAPDGSWLLFLSDHRFVLSRFVNGEWSEPLELGEPLNTSEAEFAPAIDPAGKFLFFSRYSSRAGIPDKRLNAEEFMQAIAGARNGLGDVYFISTDSIPELAVGN